MIVSSYTAGEGILISRCTDILLLWKKEKTEQAEEKLISLALNINVCFGAIPFQEDPAPAVERLNDRDYLCGKPHETADW